MVVKWEICSCSNIDGTEVLAVIDAENEAEANQIANERFNPAWGGEDIIVRPMAAWKLAKLKEEVPELAASNQGSVFSFAVSGIKDVWNEGSQEVIYVTIGREHLSELLTGLLKEALERPGEDVYGFKLVGKLEQPEF